MAVLATVFVYSSTVNANIGKRHVQLVTPAPFVWAEYGPTNPLATDGSDYPCKVPHGDAFKIQSTATKINIGEEQTVSFSGTAVHGGGSCQFALTEGHAPTPDSVWKVIQSIEGGCPKANVTGNLEDGQSPDTYTFTIPDDFDAGDYTWAWTWVNKISGSPEFYMNCSPITVVGASGSTKRVKERRNGQRRATRTYPDLFLANIGEASNGCDTSEASYSQIAIAYPHPGDSVSHPNGQEDLFPQPCDGNPRNNGAAAGSSATGAATPTGVPTPTKAPSSAPTGSAATSAAPEPTMSIETVPNDTPTSSAAAAASTSTPNGTCTDGHLMCVGGTQFSTCTGGLWTAPQSLGENVTCVEQGESEGLDTTYHYEQ